MPPTTVCWPNHSFLRVSTRANWSSEFLPIELLMPRFAIPRRRGRDSILPIGARGTPASNWKPRRPKLPSTNSFGLEKLRGRKKKSPITSTTWPIFALTFTTCAQKTCAGRDFTALSNMLTCFLQLATPRRKRSLPNCYEWVRRELCIPAFAAAVGRVSPAFARCWSRMFAKAIPSHSSFQIRERLLPFTELSAH